MTIIAPLALASTVALAACGSGTAAPADSSSDSGSPAAWIGTKGVEVTITNPTSQSVYVGTRQNNDIRELKAGESRTFRGERSGADDVELFLRWASSGSQGLELDFSNPAVGYPNVTIGEVARSSGYPTKTCPDLGFRFSEGEEKRCKAYTNDTWTALGFRRESDSSDFKRFTIGVCRGESGPYMSNGWYC